MDLDGFRGNYGSLPDFQTNPCLSLTIPNLLESKQEFTENYEWVSASIDSSSDCRLDYDGLWQ